MKRGGIPLALMLWLLITALSLGAAALGTWLATITHHGAGV
jgi:hypothetical protein